MDVNSPEVAPSYGNAVNRLQDSKQQSQIRREYYIVNCSKKVWDLATAIGNTKRVMLLLS